MYSEAEIQFLIALVELAQPKETPNNNHYHFYPKTLDEAGLYFKCLRVDWSAAGPGLAVLGLLKPAGPGWQLTAEGLAEAHRLRNERPPIYYWYEEFFTLAPASPTYSEFCTRLYGLDLCQAGFSDQPQVHALLSAAHLGPGLRALDLGCGAGKLAETLSDQSGAYVTGLDYSPAAVNGALERTAAKRDRLEFRVGNMDALDFAPESFDCILAVDTLYMPTDLADVLGRLNRMLKPGGRLLAYFMQFIWDSPAGREGLHPKNTPLGEALRRLGMPFETQDFSAGTYALMQRKHRLGVEMQPRFAAEGNQILADYILAESDASSTPFDPHTVPFTRYLYIVEKA